MKGFARSRSPRRDQSRDLHAFAALGERLLCSDHEISDEALSMCRRMLARAEAAAIAQHSPWAAVLHRHHDELKVLLDSKSAWQMATTSRCLSVDFQDRIRKDHDKLHGLIHGWPNYRQRDLVSPQGCMYHSPLMWHILNGRVEEVKFMLQFGADVNQPEKDMRYTPRGCDMCKDVKCKLLQYTFWEIAVIMATSKSPSLRRQQVRELLRQYGGHSSQPLPSKRRFLIDRSLHGPVGHGDPRSRWGEACDIDDSGTD